MAEVRASFVGLDGCRGGWICARQDGAAGLALSRVHRLGDLLAPRPHPLVAIDIPIGLPERVGPRGRAPRVAGPSAAGRASIFGVLYVGAGGGDGGPGSGRGRGHRYGAARAVARATSDPPKAVAKPCFHLFAKIVEADTLLRGRPDPLPHLHECHPEVAFWAMNGRAALREPKTARSRPYPPGLDLRIGRLASQGIPVDALAAQSALALQAGLDDLIDACACAWSAKRVAYGKALRFPDPPERDIFGLPICLTV
ncbi:DUF429 domain-containing protein [Xanthobacter sp. V4C-4]|uniref:DUF429 domain-containing protein n=1 Tax=Xanthobacter cornucopiae TaxID=3119924 RepID=UPI00372BEEE1